LLLKNVGTYQHEWRHPDFPLAYDSRAVVPSKSGRARQAIPFHQRAISLNPRDPSFYYNSAVSFLIMGDVKNAQEQKQQLEKLDPAMAEHLAMMIAKQQKQFLEFGGVAAAALQIS
jgi:tetratricopeptide (TPR) repeat protein